MYPSLQETADSVTFTEEIVDGKLHFLCSEGSLPANGTFEMLFVNNFLIIGCTWSRVSIVLVDPVLNCW